MVWFSLHTVVLISRLSEHKKRLVAALGQAPAEGEKPNFQMRTDAAKPVEVRLTNILL